MREALEAYVEQHRQKKQLVERALRLQGILDGDAKAEAFATSVRAMRGRWR